MMANVVWISQLLVGRVVKNRNEANYHGYLRESRPNGKVVSCPTTIHQSLMVYWWLLV